MFAVTVIRRFKTSYHTETDEQEEGRRQRNLETIREWKADPINAARMLKTASDCLHRYHMILEDRKNFRPITSEESYEQYDESIKSFLRSSKTAGVVAFIAYLREAAKERLH